jgi:hypothetical protein
MRKKKRYVTLNEALQLVHDSFGRTPKDAPTLSIKTLYNDIWKGKLTNYGSKPAMVDPDQVLSLHGRKISA